MYGYRDSSIAIAPLLPPHIEIPLRCLFHKHPRSRVRHCRAISVTTRAARARSGVAARDEIQYDEQRIFADTIEMKRLIECVPNFSEGRDIAKVDAIVAAMREVEGVYLLDRESDADHNRSVITLAGEPEPVAEAALRGVGKAFELIDLTKHSGAHPRLGATDVVPFIPIEGVTIEDCVALAKRTGREIWERYRIPVYFYEAAAQRPERANLENIRKGQFEGLCEEVPRNPDRAPDIGEPRMHPTAGRW